MRIGNRIFIAVFVLILAFVPVATALSPKKLTDEYEFRTLQRRPELTSERLLSGKYMSDWEVYFKDNFFMRDAIIKACAYTELNVLKRTVVNNVFVSDGHVLPVLPYRAPVDSTSTVVREAAEKIANAARVTESYGGEYLLVGLPSQSSAFHELYPKHVFDNWDNQQKVNAEFYSALDDLGVQYVDMYTVFKDENGFEDSYYKTDHHLNIGGALRVYQKIAEELALSVYDNLEFYVLTDEMIGSRARYLHGVSPFLDKLEVFKPTIPVRTREDNGEAVAPEVLSLDMRNYGVFMGGDVGETVVKTERPELPNVLVYGASYTNAVEALLYQSCNEMRSIDQRVYTKLTIEEYIEIYKPDFVIQIVDDRSFER